MFRILLCFFAVVNSVLSFSKPAEPCRRDDNVCVTSLAQKVYASAFEGPSGSKIDPLYREKIDGTLPKLVFTLTDTTTKGFKNCEIRNTSVSSDKTSVSIEMSCPKFEMDGHYEADGTIEDVPFKGHGAYTLIAKDYAVYVQANLKSTVKDGKLFIRIVDFDVDAKLKGDLDFKLENLFNGNKELSDATHHFIKENPDFTTQYLQKPVFVANIANLVEFANTFLETVSVDGLIN